MKKLLILFAVILIGSICYAAKYNVDDQTHKYYKRELLNRGWLYGCAPFNWSLIEIQRGGFNWAAMLNRTDIMELEVKAGLNPVDCGIGNISYVIQYKRHESLDFLLNNGFSPNEVHLDHSFLTFAIYRKNSEAVKILINNGADVNMVAKGKHPLNSAIKKNDVEIVKLLLDAGAQPNEKTYILLEKSRNQEIKNLFK